MGSIVIQFNSADSNDKINSFINPRAGLTKENLQGLYNYLNALEGGAYDLTTGEIVIADRATGAVVFTGNPSNDETVTINGVVFTAKTSGATGNQWNIGVSAAANATALAAAINASSTAGIVNVITASASSGTVTLTANVAGVAGLYPLIDGLSNATVTQFTVATETARIDF